MPQDRNALNTIKAELITKFKAHIQDFQAGGTELEFQRQVQNSLAEAFFAVKANEDKASFYKKLALVFHPDKIQNSTVFTTAEINFLIEKQQSGFFQQSLESIKEKDFKVKFDFSLTSASTLTKQMLLSAAIIAWLMLEAQVLKCRLVIYCNSCETAEEIIQNLQAQTAMEELEAAAKVWADKAKSLSPSIRLITFLHSHLAYYPQPLGFLAKLIVYSVLPLVSIGFALAITTPQELLTSALQLTGKLFNFCSQGGYLSVLEKKKKEDQDKFSIGLDYLEVFLGYTFEDETKKKLAEEMIEINWTRMLPIFTAAFNSLRGPWWLDKAPNNLALGFSSPISTNSTLTINPSFTQKAGIVLTKLLLQPLALTLAAAILLPLCIANKAYKLVASLLNMVAAIACVATLLVINIPGYLHRALSSVARHPQDPLGVQGSLEKVYQQCHANLFSGAKPAASNAREFGAAPSARPTYAQKDS